MRDIESNWADACRSMAVLSKEYKPAYPLFTLEPVLAAYVLGLAGAQKRALRDAVHACLDVRVRYWHATRFSFSSSTRKAPTHSADVAGTALRIRLSAAAGMTVDIVGKGGFLSGDEIILDAILPDTVLAGCVGRTVGDILGPGEGRYDDKRRIVSAHIRFKRTSVLKLEPAKNDEIPYRKLLGNPEKRFPPREISYSFK